MHMTAKVVTVFNQKGGCGKTTLTMSLAGAMGLRGFKVLLVDMDPQGTAVRWAAGATDENPFPASVMSLSPMEGKMHKEVRNHMDAYDVILIDCPPSMNSAAPSSAMLISDLALIPVVPSPADVWAAQSAKKLTETAQATNETLQAFVVANMVQSRTSLANDLLAVLDDDKEIPLLKNMLATRTAFREAQILGTTVHSVPRAQAAIDEVEAMTDNILQLLMLPARKKKGVPA
jgi:chromosome partitioning protein